MAHSHSDDTAEALSHLQLACNFSDYLVPAHPSPSKAPSTFHPFSRLPAELRIRIWELNVEPRTVEVRVAVEFKPPEAGCNGWDGTKNTKRMRALAKKQRYFPRVFSPTPVPAVLHTCREARELGLYQKVFGDLPIQLGGHHGAVPRYVYLNLDIDMVSIGNIALAFFKPIAHLITRLRFTRGPCSDTYHWEAWDRWESQELRTFTNVEEMHVVCEGGSFWDWCGTSDEFYWPCGPENVTIVHPDTNEARKLLDIEYEMDRSVEDGEREEYPDEVVVYKAGQSYYPAQGDVLPDDLYSSVRAPPAEQWSVSEVWKEAEASQRIDS